MPRGMRKINRHPRKRSINRNPRKSTKRVKVDVIRNGGRNDMSVVIERNDVVKNSIYSTPNNIDRDSSKKIIHGIMKKYSKSMKKLAE